VVNDMDPASRKTHETPTEDRAWPGADRIADPASGTAASGPEGDAGGGRRRRRKRPGDGRPNERKLPLKTRIALGVAGGLLIVLGIAGLFLPFLQGILFLVLGAAVLSLTSFRIYKWLARTMGERWPGAWDRVERFRTRVRWKLRR
jgi:hypothetical protein